MQQGFGLLVKLFTTFFKIGLFTFGGGFAMIPLIQKEVVEKHGWVDRQKFVDSISVTQTVPGAVSINLGVFLGYNLAGIPGAVTAAIGVSLPSFIIILGIAVSLAYIGDFHLLERVFMGIRPAVVGLIIYAAWELGKHLSWNRGLLMVLAASLLLSTVGGVSPPVVIVLSALVGIIHYFVLVKSSLTKESEGKSTSS